MCVATDLNNGSRLQIRMNFDKAYILVETAESYVRILIMIATWGSNRMAVELLNYDDVLFDENVF